MIPQKLNLPAVVEGHTWRGLPMVRRIDTPEGGVAAPPASALALVEMFFANGRPCNADPDEPPLLTTVGASPGITITSAANWEFEIPPRILPLAAGRWNFLISTTAADGTRDPLLNGILEIRPPN